jgi:twinkle protein
MGPMSFHEVGIEVHPGARGDVKAMCPKCGPTKKRRGARDLSVNVEKGVWNCHNDGCDFQGALASAARPDWRDMAQTPRYDRPAPPPPVTALHPEAEQWFAKVRGIDPVHALDLGVFSVRSVNGEWVADPTSTNIAIPYFVNGEVVHYKYRSTVGDKRFASSKNSEPVFYNLDACRGATDVFICEGELDVIALSSIGVDTAMSVPNGAPGLKEDGTPQSADGKLKCMASGQKVLDDARRVYIAVDEDVPGQVLADELIRRIGPAKCFRVKWPAGCKDANDTLRDKGMAAVHQAIADARPVPVNGLIYADDLKEQIWRNRLGWQRRGVEIVDDQWRDFNELFRMGEGHLNIWTGTPGAGKSAFTMALAVNVALSDPSWKFAVFSPEQEPPEEFYMTLLAVYLGKAVGKATRDEFDEAVAWVDEHFILEAPEDRSLSGILELAHVCVIRHGVKGVFIDPYTEVETTRTQGMGESEAIGRDLALIRKFGQDRGVCMNVVAHPTKPSHGTRDDEKPVGPYDISGSANWNNKADTLISVFRPDRMTPTAPVEVHVMKTRRRAFGRNGMAKFGFDQESGCYYRIAQF